MAVAPRTFAGLDAYAKARGWTVRLEVEPPGPVAHKETRVSRMSVWDGRGKDAEELDYFMFPARKNTTLYEAAGLLLELVQRIPTED